MIYYACAKCGAMLEATPDMRGQPDVCPMCEAINIVPAFTGSGSRRLAPDAAILRFIGTSLLIAGGFMVLMGILLTAYMLALVGIAFTMSGDVLRTRYGGPQRFAERRSQHCPHCKALVSARQTPCDHVLHLTLTMATVGVWAVGWLLAATRKSWRCQQCGRIIPPRPPATERATGEAAPAAAPASSPQTASGPIIPRWAAVGLLCGISFGLGVLTMHSTGALETLPKLFGVSRQAPTAKSATAEPSDVLEGQPSGHTGSEDLRADAEGK